MATTVCRTCANPIPASCVNYDGSPISCLSYPDNPTVSEMISSMGTAMCAFYDLISNIILGYALTVEEVDGSPTYSNVGTLRFNQDSGFIVSQTGANSANVQLIPTFLFPDSNLVIVDMVTTGNITLSGFQNLDGQVGSGVSRVLVWKQTNKTQNGVYLQAAGAWTRTTDSDTTGELNDQVVFANYTKSGTTYGGNYFNQIITSPTIGVSDIIYQKGILGGNKLSWLVDGNETGAVKTMGSNDNFDVKFQTFGNEIYRMFTTRQVGIGISASPLAKLHVMGTDTAILDQSILYLENYAQTHSFEYKRDGSIYRTGDLYSLTTVNNNQNTSWGESALDNIDLALAQGNTAIGYRSLYDLVDIWNSTAIGDGSGENAVGDDCCYFGHDAGKNNNGNYCIFIGSNSDSSGTFSSSIAIGYNAEIFASNQLVLGAFDSPITEMYLGEGYRSSTPGNISLRGTVGSGSNISGGNFNIYPGVSTGTGITGDVVIYKAPSAGGSSSVLNTASETFKIKGTNGDIYRNGVYYSTISTLNNTWGYNAGASITSGTSNLIHGNYCGTSLTDGVSNIIIGALGGSGYTGAALVSGIENVMIGSGTGYQATSSRNTLVGYTVGYGITTGENNHIFGHRVGRGLSGSSTSGVTTGSYNVLIGNGDTARYVGSGTYNTFMGVGGGGFIQNSFATTTLGAYSGFRTAAGTVSSSLYLGHACIAQSSYECVIGGWLAANIYLGAGQFAGNEGSGTKLIDINMQPHSVANNCAYTGFANVTDGDGIDWYQSVSQATGDGDSGDIIWRYAPPGSTGTTLTTLANGLTFKGTDGSLRASRRVETAKGADIAAANDLTLGGDGNFFIITGNTTVNAILVVNWQAGSTVILMFTGTPTIKHNTAGGAGTATMKLLNGVDLVVSKNPTILQLVYDGTNWQEVSRSPNAA